MPKLTRQKSSCWACENRGKSWRLVNFSERKWCKAAGCGGTKGHGQARDQPTTLGWNRFRWQENGKALPLRFFPRWAISGWFFSFFPCRVICGLGSWKLSTIFRRRFIFSRTFSTWYKFARNELVLAGKWEGEKNKFQIWGDFFYFLQEELNEVVHLSRFSHWRTFVLFYAVFMSNLFPSERLASLTAQPFNATRMDPPDGGLVFCFHHCFERTRHRWSMVAKSAFNIEKMNLPCPRCRRRNHKVLWCCRSLELRQTCYLRNRNTCKIWELCFHSFESYFKQG